MIRRRLVRVPASSANLGPGFDCMAAAVGLHLQLEVRETGQFAIETDLPISRGRENLCVRAFEALHPADGFTFKIASEIPLAGGLGSSAAAIVAGLMAADHLFELDADLLSLATELEGHPDNVAAALHGGFVICADGAATRFEPPTGLEAIAVVPEQAVRTPGGVPSAISWRAFHLPCVASPLCGSRFPVPSSNFRSISQHQPASASSLKI